MGDSGARRFWTTFVRPSVSVLAAAFIQAFFLSFTDFGIPAAVGGEYKVVATTLYNTMLGSVPDFGTGAVVAMFMVMPSVLSIVLLTVIEKYNFRYDKISEEKLPDSKKRDALTAVASGVILTGVLGIFLVIFVIPFTEMWPYKISFTMEHFKEVVGNSQLFYIYKNTVIVALITGILGTAMAYGAAIVTSRSQLSKRLKGIIESLALVINTIPGLVLGIAFLFAFSGTSLQNTLTILVVANIVHFFSAPYLMFKNSLNKMNSSWETTAALMGDSFIKTLVRVITPNARITIMEAFEYYFINAMVTISAVIFLTGARTMVITSKMKELQYMAKFDQIFVFSILILITNILIKLIVKAVNTKNQRKI